MDKEIEQAFRTGVEQSWSKLSVDLEELKLESDKSDVASDLLYRWDKLVGEFNDLYVEIAMHLGIERRYD